MFEAVSFAAMTTRRCQLLSFLFMLRRWTLLHRSSQKIWEVVLAPIVLHDYIFSANTRDDSRAAATRINETKLICGRGMSKVQFLGITSNVFVCSILENKHSRLICICWSSAALILPVPISICDESWARLINIWIHFLRKMWKSLGNCLLIKTRLITPK